MTPRSMTAALVTMVALGWSAPARAQRVIYPYSEPIPSGYHVETQHGHSGLLKAGWITLIAGYAASAAVATAELSDTKSSEPYFVEPAWGYVPLAGGIIAVARTESTPCPSNECALARVFFDIVTLFPTAAQLVGTGLLIPGYMVARKKMLVRDDMGAIHAAPVPLGAGGMGLGVAGRF